MEHNTGVHEMPISITFRSAVAEIKKTWADEFDGRVMSVLSLWVLMCVAIFFAHSILFFGVRIEDANPLIYPSFALTLMITAAAHKLLPREYMHADEPCRRVNKFCFWATTILFACTISTLIVIYRMQHMIGLC